MENIFWIIFILYILTKVYTCWLEILNFKHLKLHGDIIPKPFKDVVDRVKIKKMQSYTVEKIKIEIFNTIYNAVIMAVFVFGGILNLLNAYILSFKMPSYVSGISLFVIIFIGYTILEIPFDLYKTFKLEKKYGFNTMTIRLWISDLIKTIIVSGIIISVLIFAVLFTIFNFTQTWWIWSWLVFFVFTMFMMYVSPYVLEPLFNKFVPVENEDLINSLKNVMCKIGIRVSKVLKMDASKRTKHTNAYFSGIGHVKRIVLFDTLMEQMNNDEIVAVIAHEAGHWKKKHIIKNVVLFEVIALIFFFAAYFLIKYSILLDVFNVSINAQFLLINYSIVELFLIYFIFGVIMFPVAPLMHFLTRKYEKEADQFAVDLVGKSSDLRNALIKLSADNLSNLFPHPKYEAFHYSHPSILKRLKYLEEMSDN